MSRRALVWPMLLGLAATSPSVAQHASYAPTPTPGRSLAIPGGAISSLDVNPYLGVHADVQAESILPEAGAVLTVGSRYLGPLHAQVAGSYTPDDSGNDVGAMMLGIGSVGGTEEVRGWGTVGVWQQLRGDDVNVAVSLNMGSRWRVTDLVGITGALRIMANDIRAEDAPAGLSGLASVGVSVRY